MNGAMEIAPKLEMADKIVDSPRDPRDNPNDRIEMKSVKIVNR